MLTFSPYAGEERKRIRLNAHLDGFKNPFDLFEIGETVSAYCEGLRRIEAKAYWSCGATFYLLCHPDPGEQEDSCHWLHCRFCTTPGRDFIGPVRASELAPLWYGQEGRS